MHLRGGKYTDLGSCHSTVPSCRLEIEARPCCQRAKYRPQNLGMTKNSLHSFEQVVVEKKTKSVWRGCFVLQLRLVAQALLARKRPRRVYITEVLHRRLREAQRTTFLSGQTTKNNELVSPEPVHAETVPPVVNKKRVHCCCHPTRTYTLIK